MLASCRHPSRQESFLLPGNQSAEYIQEATRINYVDVDKPLDERVTLATEPRRLSREEKETIWDVTLADAIHLALANSRVIRNSGQFLSPGNPILNNPDFVTTVYDPAIQDAGVLFGQRGVEAALSDFDTQFVTQMLWGHNEAIQNNAFTSGGLAPGSTLVNHSGNFSSTLQKRLGTGGQVALSHAWNYTGSNVPAALFPSVYEGNLRAEFRQPLLAGGGAEYTRIAGPISTNIQGVTGVQQGVIVARINNDIALADFERQVSQLVHDVESLYWQLHLAYQAFDTQTRTRDEVLTTWQLVDSQRRAKTGQGGAQELNVREIEVQLEGQVQQSRDQIYTVEAQLRLLMGLPVNDGRIIRPVDNPITARLEPDWNSCLSDALVRRPEIRHQKWNIKSIEMQLRAAENLTMPRLDFVAAYQANGFGDNLLGSTSDGRSPQGTLGNAYGTLLAQQQTGWNMGFEFSMPLGRRFAYTQQRSLELRLAKSRDVLSAQEVEISHEVASVFRDLDRNYLATQNALNRVGMARERLRLAKIQYQSDSERYTIDSVLRAQEALGQAEVQFLNALIQYNNSVNDLHFRTGRTLSGNNILLSEGSWTPEAYGDADERYRRRLHALDAPWREQTLSVHQNGTVPPVLTAPVYDLSESFEPASGEAAPAEDTPPPPEPEQSADGKPVALSDSQ